MNEEDKALFEAWKKEKLIAGKLGIGIEKGQEKTAHESIEPNKPKKRSNKERQKFWEEYNNRK